MEVEEVKKKKCQGSHVWRIGDFKLKELTFYFYCRAQDNRESHQYFSY